MIPPRSSGGRRAALLALLGLGAALGCSDTSADSDATAGDAVADAARLDAGTADAAGPDATGPDATGPDATPPSCPPPTAGRLSGVFMAYYPGYGQTTEGWTREFDAMRRACLDLVIWQSSAWFDVTTGEHVVYYPDATLGSSIEELGGDGSHIIPALLDAAAARGMKVMLGLGSPWSWDWTNDVPGTEALLDVVATDLVSLYGSHPGFGGLYITIELSLNRLSDDAGFRAASLSLYSHLVATVSALETGGPIRLAVAPFYAVHPGPFEGSVDPIDPATTRTVVRDLVDAAPFDVLMIQDGVGVEHAQLTNDDDPATDPDVHDVFAAAAAALADHRDATGHPVELWNDVEIFAHTGHDWDSGLPVLYPADIGRVRQQITVTAPLVDRAVAFEWGHYVAATAYPDGNRVAASKLLEHLIDWYVLGYGNLARGQSYESSPPPAAAYPDEGGTLTDGLSAYEGSYANPGWAGWDSVPVSVVVSLDAPHRVRRASAHVLTDTSASIGYPARMSVAWSADGSAWHDAGDAGPMSAGQGDWPRGATEHAVVYLDAQARFVRFSFEPAGWLFVSEVEVLGEP